MRSRKDEYYHHYYDIDMSYDYDDKRELRLSTHKMVFEVDPRILEFSLVKPKNNRKQASLERIPKFLGKPRKVE